MPTPGAIADDVAIYLHIGQMKTGTTALQRTLARELKNLLRHGVLHPKTGALHKHSDIAWSLLSCKKMGSWVARKSDDKHIDEIKAELVNEITEGEEKTVVIICKGMLLYSTTSL